VRLIRISVVCFLLLCANHLAWPLPIRVLATGDMHGWLEAQPAGKQQLGGAAEMLACWERVEKYSPKRFLVVACGDIATGPALSTIFKGEPVIEAMNRMGYDACVVGNHEFDFGLDNLAKWERSAKFPFLAANLSKPDGAPSDMVLPYMLYDEQGVKVGVIGLATQGVERIANTAGLLGQPYVETLRKWVPQLRAKGARMVVVVAHAPMADLVELAKAVGDLDIPLMLGGHSHELGQIKVQNTWVVNSGEWWRGYSRIDLDYDPETGKAIVLAAKQVWLQQANPRSDRRVAQEIARWHRSMQAEFRVPMGYTASGLQRSAGLYNFVLDCWLAMDSRADIALSNYGSLRQDIPPGPITKETFVGVMPFTNSLLRLTLTGDQLLTYLPKDGSIGMAGLRWQGGKFIVAKTGEQVDPQATYRVLINDYMYNTNRMLQVADPKPERVYEDWRQPVYDWLASHPSSKDKPLETLVDLRPRNVP